MFAYVLDTNWVSTVMLSKIITGLCMRGDQHIRVPSAIFENIEHQHLQRNEIETIIDERDRFTLIVNRCAKFGRGSFWKDD